MGIEHENARTLSPTYWLALVSALLAIKIVLFVMDPSPMFFMGDSGAYIGTALKGYMPLDRSTLYGLIIRYTAVFAHSLASLVMLQILGSVIAIFCMAVILVRYFGVSPGLTAAVSIVACIEPLQLMMERYVMTESLGVTAFAVFVLLAISYISRPSTSKIPWLQLSGILLIALRVSYLPIVQVVTVLAPVLAAIRHRNTPDFRLQRYGLHALLSVSLFMVVHSGYQHAMGQLHKQPPAYQYADGLFMLAALAPLLDADDFADPELGRTVVSGLDLENFNLREAHRWREGMLVSRLTKEVPDLYAANRIAKQASYNIIRRNPFGPIRLGFRTWMAFYDLRTARGQVLALMADHNARPLPEWFLTRLSRNFALDARKLPSLDTLSNKVGSGSLYWYLFLVSLPLVMLLWLPFRSARDTRIVALWVIGCGLLAAATIPVTVVSFRYIVPLGWLGLVLLAVFLQHLKWGSEFMKRIQAAGQ